MTKDKEILTSINLEPLEFSLIIYYAKDFSTIVKHLNKKSNKSISDYLKARLDDIEFKSRLKDTVGTVWLQDETIPVLMFIKADSKGMILNTIVHETNHVVEYFADSMGFQAEKEFKAYLQAHIFTKIANKIL